MRYILTLGLLALVYSPFHPSHSCGTLTNLLAEADAISNYSVLFRRSEGLYLTFPSAYRMEEDYLAQTSNKDIELVGESFMDPDDPSGCDVRY